MVSSNCSLIQVKIKRLKVTFIFALELIVGFQTGVHLIATLAATKHRLSCANAGLGCDI